MTNRRMSKYRPPCIDSFRVALCIFTLFAEPLTAHAYLDPGAGSLLFQSLLAVLFSIGVGLRQFRQWIARAWAFISRRRPSSGDNGR